MLSYAWSVYCRERTARISGSDSLTHSLSNSLAILTSLAENGANRAGEEVGVPLLLVLRLVLLDLLLDVREDEEPDSVVHEHSDEGDVETGVEGQEALPLQDVPDRLEDILVREMVSLHREPGPVARVRKG